ncbi:MAG TPA: hypothetical protein VJN43_00150 [Bryobacteraceae bacterium]|nr:hypothetical protein [Bryobacteraceae bacterium]
MNRLMVLVAAAFALLGPLRAQTIRAPFSVSDYFSPEGWMGDGSRGTQVLEMDENYTQRPRPGDRDGKCIRISWQPRRSTWAGLYWQSPAGNWGTQPGRNVEGATRVVFWAAGDLGSEVVEFRAGGLRTMNLPYKDSFGVSLGAVRLSGAWRRYEISLRAQKLSSVIGAFAWVVRKASNPSVVTFYLDDIHYE